MEKALSVAASQTPITSLFLSYARGDDEPFVRRLHDDLTKAGFDVWFDRVSMPSRQLTFHQEIADAIRVRDRLILVVGPKAALSDYVRQEWRWAIELDKPVIPILRLGDYPLIPGEVSLLHCDDFRDDGQYPAQLTKLIANLNHPEPPLGKLHAVPGLPPHYLGRPDLMRRLKDAVLVDLQKPVVITGAAARVGVQGMGGIGKSVVAAALARDREVRRSYPDGVIWVDFGQHPNLAQLQRDVVRTLGGTDQFENETQGRIVLQQLLAGKAVFLVLDDVWEARHAMAFDVLGPRCRALVTTRDAGILHTLNGVLHQIALLTEPEALQLLADCVDLPPHDLPPEAAAIVRECGCLPLAVALCGGMAKRGIHWASILERLRRADLDKIADRGAINEQHRDIYRAMLATVEVLPADQQRRFAELAVFATDQIVPRATVATLWQHTGQLNDLDTEELLVSFSERSLIRLDKTGVSMHDLLHDFAVKLAGEPKALNQLLLDGYRTKCTHGWPTGPDDGYFLQNLIGHLLAGEHLDDVAALLSDLPWIVTKCKAGLVFDLQRDYRDTMAVLPEAQPELTEQRQRDERIARWTKEITAYSRLWSNRRDRIARGEAVSEPEPVLPEVIPSVGPWSNERIEAECRRIVSNPIRLDRLRAFAGFVEAECYSLLEFGRQEGFIIQHAVNRMPSGPVYEAATHLILESRATLLRKWPFGAVYNPKPASLRILEGHSAAILSVLLSPDSRVAVSAGDDGTLRVWDMESGECLRILKGHRGWVHSLSMTSEGRFVLSGSEDKTVRLWDLYNGTCMQVLTGHTRGITSVAATPDARIAVSASDDQSLQVWDLVTGTRLRSLTGHRREVTSVSITPDGRRAVSLAHDKTLRVWDLDEGTCVGTFVTGCHGESVSVTPDGRRAICGGWGELQLWDLVAGTYRTLTGHSFTVRGVSITPDGLHAATSSEDDTVRVWDLESGNCLRVLTDWTNVLSVSISVDGRRVISGSGVRIGESKVNTVRFWNIESASCEGSVKREFNRVRVICSTADGRLAVSGNQQGVLQLWDIETGTCLRTLDKCHESWIMGASFLPDRRLISVSMDKTIRFWNLETGLCLRTFGEFGPWIRSISVMPDGRRAVSAVGQDLRVWDLNSGACLYAIPSPDGEVWTASVSPDGRRAVSGGEDKNLRVWDLESRDCVHVLTGHREGIWSVKVMPDARHAISGGQDGDLRVWDLDSGACLRVLTGHTRLVWNLTVMPDGRHVVSVSDDRTLRVWDLVDERCLAVAVGDFPWTAVMYSAPLNRLVAGTYTGEVIFFDMIGIPHPN